MNILNINFTFNENFVSICLVVYYEQETLKLWTKKVKINKRSQRPGGTAKQGAIKNLHILTLYKPDKISVNSRLLTIMIFI